MLFPSDILTSGERGGESGGFATTDKELLESWKEIGAHLRRSPKTCRRWAHELGLPVHRLDGSPKARVFAYSEELDRWKADKLKEGNPQLLANDGPSTGHEAVKESPPSAAEASGEPSAASRVVMTASGRKTIAFVAATVTVAAAAVLFLWKPWARGISTLSPSGHPNLAVLYFENISRDRGLDDWITGIPQLLMTDLNQSRFISLLSYDEVYGILLALGLKDVQKYASADLTRIARQGRATHTITGSILKAGDKIILTLAMRGFSGKDGRPWSAEFTCSNEAEIPAAADKMTISVKQALGLTRSQIAGDLDSLTVDITTSSIEAFKLYNEGRRLYVAGKAAESVPLMLKAVEKDPEFAMAYRALCMGLWSIGRREEGLRYLQKALEFSDRASLKEGFWIQSDCYNQSERTLNQSREILQKWLDLYPDDDSAWGLTGFWHLLVQDYGQAAKFLETSLQKGNVNPFVHYHLGAAYNGSGDYEKARLAAERGLSLFPDNGLIKGIFFRSYVSLRKIDEARALLKTWAAASPGLDVDIRRGDLEAILGKYDGAASIFAKYDPLNDFIKTRLPFLMLWEGKVGRALDMARSAGDHLSLIYLNSRAGKFDEALAESEKAIQEALEKGSFSGQAEAFQMRGLAELASGNVPAAERTAEALKRCVAEAPNRRLAGLYHFLLAMIESEAGRYTQAVGDLRKAIELQPAESWTEEGYPCRPHPCDGLAAVYFRSGDLGRAKEEYRRIQSFPLFRLQHGDIYATSFYWLGRIAEEEGKKAEASAHYRKFLDLWKNADPGLPEVEDAKQRISGRS